VSLKIGDGCGSGCKNARKLVFLYVILNLKFIIKSDLLQGKERFDQLELGFMGTKMV